MFPKEVYDSLPPYGQVLLTLGIVVLGLVAAIKGWMDRNKKTVVTEDPRIIPMWLMMGPVHDALQSIHNMAEESRTQTAELKDIGKIITAMDRGQGYTHYLLEALLRNQEMSGDYKPPSQAPHNQPRRPRS